MEKNKLTLEAMPDVLTADDLAAFLRTTRQNVYKILKSGAIHSVKVGRAYRVPKCHLIEFLRG
jgi:excisionase family DNA binding protein